MEQASNLNNPLFKINDEYLYENTFGTECGLVLSNTHLRLNRLFKMFNDRIQNLNYYYLADASRKLIQIIEIIFYLHWLMVGFKVMEQVQNSLTLKEYYFMTGR
ncbi:hypothetical protein [Streptococcus tangpeifui]|uniref:hypothetical protein n=1 Tax=Streptococcus tangpeifui TaxID=2709400 RepID=UPI0013E9FC11|nr:hypothetical protein [Streptococcus sp. ZJ373]